MSPPHSGVSCAWLPGDLVLPHTMVQKGGFLHPWTHRLILSQMNPCPPWCQAPRRPSCSSQQSLRKDQVQGQAGLGARPLTQTTGLPGACPHVGSHTPSHSIPCRVSLESQGPFDGLHLTLPHRLQAVAVMGRRRGWTGLFLATRNGVLFPTSMGLERGQGGAAR